MDCKNDYLPNGSDTLRGDILVRSKSTEKIRGGTRHGVMVDVGCELFSRRLWVPSKDRCCCG